MNDEQIEMLLEARERISAQAAQLTTLFPAFDVAKLFFGPAVTILRKAHGDDAAANYLADLSEVIRQGGATLQ